MNAVSQFATALDCDDYVGAERLLRPDAIYVAGDRIVRGAREIVISFKDVAVRGRMRLDTLEFSHRIDPESPATITFVDVLRIGADTLRLEHDMHVILAGDGSIAELRLESVPGERELVEDFFEQHGR